MSFLILAFCDSMNWDDVIGVRPQFGLKVIALMRQAASSPRYHRTVWSGAGFRVSFMHSGRLTTGPHPHLAGSGPGRILVIENVVIPHSLGFPRSFCTAAYRSVGVADFWAWGTAFLFLPHFSSENENSLCFGDYHKHWPSFGCTCLHPISKAKLPFPPQRQNLALRVGFVTSQLLLW